MRPRILCVLALTAWGLGAHAAKAPAVHEYALDNGLKLLVREDHRAPVAVSQIWYKVGSSYEHGGITGLSHMLEHMMFKGTKRYGPGEFSRIIAAEGGSENAFTGSDYTAYFQRLAKDRLEVSFRLEADRMTGLLLDPAELRKERDVVTEERRMRTEDRPQSQTYERFRAAAYQTSPYHHPVIGWMADIKHYQADDLRAWYRQWYAPNNATLVVVGDVDPEEVYRLARKHFGPLAPARIRPTKPRPEVPQKGLHSLQVKVPARLPYLVMGYKVPSVRTAEVDWEPYALAVLAAVLDGDDSARLSRELVRGAEVAASAGAGYDLYSRLTTLFELDAAPAEGQTLGAVEKALAAQLKKLREEPVTPAELERVKTQVVASDVYQRDSVFYQAMRIGRLESIGLPWRLADEYVERIRAVTPEQVREVARKYLVEDGLTVARLDPLPMKGRRAHRPAQGGRHDALR